MEKIKTKINLYFLIIALLALFVSFTEADALCDGSMYGGVKSYNPDPSTVCQGLKYNAWATCNISPYVDIAWNITGTKPVRPWTPDPSTVCNGAHFSQTNNCATRGATGTKTDTVWMPDPSAVCSGISFTQIGADCGQKRLASGTKNCSSSISPDKSLVKSGTAYNLKNECSKTVGSSVGTKTIGSCVDNGTRTPSASSICTGNAVNAVDNCGLFHGVWGTKSCPYLPAKDLVPSGISYQAVNQCGDTIFYTGTKSMSTWTPNQNEVCYTSPFDQTNGIGSPRNMLGTLNFFSKVTIPNPLNLCPTSYAISTNGCRTELVQGTHDCTPGSCNPSFNKQSFFTLSSSSSLCSTGSVANFSGTGPWTWNCLGSLGPVASCSAYLSAGNCGTSNGQYFLTAPTSDLCLSGTASAVTGAGPWNWTCNGTACSANIKYSCPNSCSNLFSYATTTAFESSDVACTIPIGLITYAMDCTCGEKASDPYGYESLCCTPNNSGCAADTCVGDTCFDGCNNIPGTKTTGSCCTPNNSGCAADTCVGDTCFDGCNNIPGTKTTGSCCFMSSGQCGSAENMTWDAVPDSDLCNSAGGNSTPKVSGGNWTWTCEGTCGGNDKVCSSQRVDYKEIAP
ncbi:MAG: hypothetical protein WC906_02705 [Parcubacteria group bacterium]